MTEYEFSMIKDNNPYKTKCEIAEEDFNTENYIGSVVTMAITLEKLTKDLIRYSKIKIFDIEYSTQSDRINKLKYEEIITYNLSQDFYRANTLRNDILHGDKPANYQNASLMKKYFLKIMVWYDVNYVPLEINPRFKLKQYLNKICDDSSIISIIKVEIDEGKITENHQIIKRIKEELIKYVESLDIELEIKEKIIKDISSGIIKNIYQIDEKIKGQKKNPRIGVANIVNTENMMKYTIQSEDIDKELKENMEKLENNTHENKQLQEDYNKYGSTSFTTETVTLCKNKTQTQMVKEDEIIFNANKSYNYIAKKEKESEKTYYSNIDDAKNNKKYIIQATDNNIELKEKMTNRENKEEITSNENKSNNPNNQSNGFGNRIKKFFKK